MNPEAGRRNGWLASILFLSLSQFPVSITVVRAGLSVGCYRAIRW